ncbi:unnamed protein product [Oreochromis niloticus]|nr:unnamed protein product [Mustela putorius furo]
MIFTKPVPNRMAQTGVWSGFYRGMVGSLPDPCLFRITEAYAKFNIEDRPLVTTMNMRPDKPLVESAFGLVQEGSVLSYQQPVLTTRYITLHRDAPPTPHLPLEGYDILPSDCVFVCLLEPAKRCNPNSHWTRNSCISFLRVSTSLDRSSAADADMSNADGSGTEQ